MEEDTEENIEEDIEEAEEEREGEIEEVENAYADADEIEDSAVEEISEEPLEEFSEEDVDETVDETEETGEETDEETTKFLISRQKYLASGIHIGMKQHTRQMQPFVYKIRPDGLAVMNLRLIDERIKIAAQFLARAKKVIVVGRRGIAHKPIEKFAEIVGFRAIKGRFMPGTLTNPNYEGFYEADVVLVVDPMSDYQAVKEGKTGRRPIIAICDTFNETNDIDLVIPANNKGAKSLATLFWLLGREILKERGKIKSDEEYTYKVSDFMAEFERRGRSRDSDQKRPGRRGDGQRDRSRTSRKRPTRSRSR